ncbi:demethoxyubiquinone hydroxylase family protein [Pokkaliibacter plantistimulans]|nr:demethoxyubiquinone hydroxylase family protein [Pokkaliibacter plantistimulans]
MNQGLNEKLMPDTLEPVRIASKIMKINHAGEFGAINIYRAQIMVARLFSPQLVATLEDFLSHEQKHLEIFGRILQSRGIARCKSFWLCGIGGFCLGLITALMGRAGIMTCTAAVETVVTHHLLAQLASLEAENDSEAYQAVQSILSEVLEHQQHGIEQSKDSLLFKPVSAVVSCATSAVIWLGFQL